VAKEYGLEQTSLSRFLRRNRGLSGAYILALFPFVYDDEWNTSVFIFTRGKLIGLLKKANRRGSGWTDQSKETRLWF